MCRFFTGFYTCCLWHSLSYLNVWLLVDFSDVEQRGWGPGISGLAFVGIGCGSIIGVALTPITNRNYLSQMKKHANGKPIWPEARLPPTFIGAFLMPISLFWYKDIFNFR